MPSDFLKQKLKGKLELVRTRCCNRTSFWEKKHNVVLLRINKSAFIWPFYLSLFAFCMGEKDFTQLVALCHGVVWKLKCSAEMLFYMIVLAHGALSIVKCFCIRLLFSHFLILNSPFGMLIRRQLLFKKNIVAYCSTYIPIKCNYGII